MQIPKAVSDAIVDRRANSFDFFRLAAATFVIFYHSHQLTGLEQYGIFGLLGVSIFFTISGYFITRSWCQSRSNVHFLWNRFLRLIPALALVTLLGVFIIGPLTTALPLEKYFIDRRTWLCLLNIPLVTGAFNLPGVFLNNPITKVVNAPLWTLNLEARMYAAVMVLGMMGLLKRKKLIAGMTLAIAVLYVIGFFLAPTQAIKNFIGIPFTLMPQPNNVYPPLYALVFMIGALLYLYKDVIKFHPLPAACLALIWISSISTHFLLPATLLCLPYLVISIGFMKLPLVDRLVKHGDFSYGLYIFAFPIQQTVVFFMPMIGPEFLFAASFSLTLLLAILSWKLVESRALKLKRDDPGELWKKLVHSPRAFLSYK
jgi:peptidoglycan/LPS O-acetylase OafA/YrhL